MVLQSLHIIRTIANYSDIRNTEIFLSWYSFMIGLWILNPIVDTFSTAPSFRTLSLLPEVLWGGTIVITSVIHFVAYIRRLNQIRRIALFTFFMIWFFIALAFFFSNPLGLGLISYGMISLSFGLAFIHARRSPTR